MTDQDRGAYTPFADEPLAFDPRESGRRPMPMTLILSGLVLIGLVGGVGMVYRHGVRHADDAGRVVGQPVLKVKTAPPATAAAQANPSDQPLDVYGAANPAPASSGPSAPSFAPAPEQPSSRVAVLPPAPPLRSAKAESGSEYADAAGLTTKAPSSQAEAAAPAAAERSAISDETAPAKAVPTKAAPSKTADVKKHAKRDAAQPKTVKAASADETATADASKPAKAASRSASSDADEASAKVSGPVVQIGAFASNAQAARGWSEMAALMSDRMSGKTKHVLKIEKGGQTFYRTWVAGFGSRADAQAFCEALKAKGKACLVKG